MKDSTVFVQGNVHGREEEESVRAKQPTSAVPTLVNNCVKSKCKNQEFIQSLDNPTKNDLLVKSLSMGRGSLDFAKKLVADNLPEEPAPPKYLPVP